MNAISCMILGLKVADLTDVFTMLSTQLLWVSFAAAEPCQAAPWPNLRRALHGPQQKMPWSLVGRLLTSYHVVRVSGCMPGPDIDLVIIHMAQMNMSSSQ
jgi:hypothetical protein